MKTKRGFTLIELLVVIAIIGLLASVVLVALDKSRLKSRDAKRRGDMQQMVKAMELRYTSVGSYPGSAGWFSNPGHGGLDAALVPTYMAKVPDDPRNGNGYVYMYWLKSSRSGCLTAGTDKQYGFYARLENPTAEDTATLVDSFDLCVQSTWGMNYKAGIQ